jgi:hypothetical protein
MGLITSAFIHIAMLVAIALPHHRQTAHGEAVTVDILTPDQVPQSVRDTPMPAPQKQPQSQSFSLPSASQPAPQSPAQPPVQPSWSQQSPPPTPADRTAGEATQAAPRAQQQPQARQPQAQPSQAQPSQAQPSQAQQAPVQQPQQAQQSQPQAQQPQAQQPQPSAAARASSRTTPLSPLTPMPQRQQQMPDGVPPTQQQAATPPQSEDPPATENERNPNSLAALEERFAVLMAIPPSKLAQPGQPVDRAGESADTKAKVALEEIAAFKAQLRKCWSLPEGVASTQHVKVIVRVALKQDGSLAGNPELIEFAPTPSTPGIVQSAMRALRQCAPYRMLPAAKYDQWKLLDLNFSPDAMAGS